MLPFDGIKTSSLRSQLGRSYCFRFCLAVFFFATSDAPDYAIQSSNALLILHPPVGVNSTVLGHAFPAGALRPTDSVPEAVPLKVYTMEGKVLKLGVAPGTTLISDIRAAVAAATGATASEVRNLHGVAGAKNYNGG